MCLLLSCSTPQRTGSDCCVGPAPPRTLLTGTVRRVSSPFISHPLLLLLLLTNNCNNMCSWASAMRQLCGCASTTAGRAAHGRATWATSWRRRSRSRQSSRAAQQDWRQHDRAAAGRRSCTGDSMSVAAAVLYTAYRSRSSSYSLSRYPCVCARVVCGGNSSTVFTGLLWHTCFWDQSSGSGRGCHCCALAVVCVKPS